MKPVLAVAVALLMATPAVRATDVGVSIAISQPGVYGRIDIGRFPQPAVIVPQPVIIAPQPVVVAPQPVYMWVPYEHRKHWDRYCPQYGACGVPVYFVRHDWYDQHVGYGHGKGHGKGKGKKHD
jgi:PXPV repeat (3 copies)